jgi:hypothetical protein
LCYFKPFEEYTGSRLAIAELFKEKPVSYKNVHSGICFNKPISPGFKPKPKTRITDCCCTNH